MARIDMGNFGNRLPDAPQKTRIAGGDGGVGRAVQGLAAVGMQIGADMRDTRNAEDEGLARARAANALLDHELAMRSRSEDIAERVRTGEIDWRQADEAFDEATQEIQAPELDELDPVLQEQMQGGLRRNLEGARASLRVVTGAAKRADFKGQFFSALDTLGKIAGQPGADLEAIHQRAEAFQVLAQQAELPADVVGRTLQEFRDKNWTNHATQRYIEGKDDPAALAQLERDLSTADGYYASRLDTDRRNALLAQVMAGRTRLETRAEVEAAKRESVAESEITWLRDNIVTGREIAAERWTQALENVRGTSREGDLAQVRAEANEILGFRQMPFARQEAYLQQVEAQMRSTPSADPKRDQSRLNTLRGAFDAQRKLASEAPLVFYEQQVGVDVPPLALDQLATGGAELLQAQLTSRFAVLGAMRKQYGDDVALNPWRPEEVVALKGLFEKLPDEQRLNVLSTLVGAAPSPEAFAAGLRPIASEDPMFMAAGMARFRKLQGPDGADVAKLMIAGARILKDKSVIQPGDRAMRRAFDDRVGDALPPGSTARQRAFDVFRAVYAGRAEALGKRHEDTGEMIEADEELADDAIALTTGGVSEVNDRRVLRPYGMEEGTFLGRVHTALRGAAERTGFPLDRLRSLPLVNAPDQEGAYLLLNGNDWQLDKDGNPVRLVIQ